MLEGGQARGEVKMSLSEATRCQDTQAEEVKGSAFFCMCAS